MTLAISLQFSGPVSLHVQVQRGTKNVVHCFWLISSVQRTKYGMLKEPCLMRRALERAVGRGRGSPQEAALSRDLTLGRWAGLRLEEEGTWCRAPWCPWGKGTSTLVLPSFQLCGPASPQLLRLQGRPWGQVSEKPLTGLSRESHKGTGILKGAEWLWAPALWSRAGQRSGHFPRPALILAAWTVGLEVGGEK